MVRSDLFLISNYVHLGSEEYMTLILMIANATGLFIPALPSPISGKRVALIKKNKTQHPKNNNNKKKDSVNRGKEQVEMFSFEHCKTF